MHPHDAAIRRLTDGMMVRVWNDRGEVHPDYGLPKTSALGDRFAERRLVPHQR